MLVPDVLLSFPIGIGLEAHLLGLCLVRLTTGRDLKENIHAIFMCKSRFQLSDFLDQHMKPVVTSWHFVVDLAKLGFIFLAPRLSLDQGLLLITYGVFGAFYL
jgi:hypothetical protein